MISLESFSLNSALENKANVSRETFMQLNLSLYQKTEWQKTEYLPATEAGICHEFLYVPRETFFILFHVVWKWITFITVKTLNRPDELLCGLFLLFASRVLRFGKSIV